MSYSDQVLQIWKEAIARYERVTGNTLNIQGFRGVTTVDQLLGSNDSEHRAFSDFRARRGRIFSALKSAVKYLLDAASGVSSKYDAIVELMGTLKVCIYTYRLQLACQPRPNVRDIHPQP
ncbi:hypothetical protein BJX64DRAFT_288369 [Aspergillus heterothallicus]